MSNYNHMAEHGLVETVTAAGATTTIFSDNVTSSNSKNSTVLSKVKIVNSSTDIEVGQFADADQMKADNESNVDDINAQNKTDKISQQQSENGEIVDSTNRITVTVNDGSVPPNLNTYDQLSSSSPSSASSSPVETPAPPSLHPASLQLENHQPSLEIESQKASQPDPQLPVSVNLVGPAPVLRVEQLREEDGGGGSSTVIMNYTSEEEGLSHPELSDDADERDKLPEFVEPDKELQDKIIKQVEFYFSDANILKDAFLLKHVRRNKQGYVSLKLITSFRKVKSLSKDYRVVAFSLRSASSKLEVNDEGTKVRRVDPLPEYDETTPSRSVVVVNLPIENPAIESVAELFSKCGTITLIRILRPKGSIPPDVKKYSSKHPEIGTTLCAVVEFETYEAAKLACSTMNNTDDWRKGMRVVPLSAKKKEKEKKKSNSNNSNNNGNGDKDNRLEIDRRKKKGGRKKKRIDELSRENESSCYSSGSEADTPQSSLAPMSSLDPNKLSPATTPKSSPRSSPLSSPRTPRRKWITKKSPLAETDNNSPRISPRVSPQISPESIRKRYENSDTPASPWVQRRLKAAQQQQANNSIPLNDDKNNSGRSPRGSPLMLRRVRMLDMGMVVRFPKGPDGTRGFYGGVGRGKILNNNNNNTTSEVIA